MKIVTDSAADMPAEEVRSLGVQIVPLRIGFPGQEVNSDDISPDEFYNRLREMSPDIPTTSQPSPGIFARTYQNLAASGEEILSVHISSGLSGTAESARLGARQDPNLNVSIVDTLTLSGGERFQVLAADLAAKAEWSKQAILDQLKRIQAATEVIYTLETLTYLARGGRIGRVQALAGSLLKIKPIINVDKRDGKYNSMGRERTIPKALDVIVAYLQRTYGSTPLWLSVIHGQLSEQAEALGQLVNKQLNVARIDTLRVSPALGVHTGPGVIGAAAVPMSLMDIK